MKHYVIVFVAIMDFEFMIRFVVAPGFGDQINKIVYAVFYKPDFQSA